MGHCENRADCQTVKKTVPFDPVETPPGCCRRVNDFVTACNAAGLRWMQSPAGSPQRLAACAEMALLKSLGLWCVLPLINESTHSAQFGKFAADAIASLQPLIAHDDAALFPPAVGKEQIILDNLENLQRGQAIGLALLQVLAQDVRGLVLASVRKTNDHQFKHDFNHP